MSLSPELIYLIHRKEKKVTIGPIITGLFWDADKVPETNRYIFTGTIEDILTEFMLNGYHIMEK